MNNKKCKNRGSALPLALVAILILLTMGTTLLSMGLTNRIFSMRNVSTITARCAADAGLTQALFEMNEKLQNKTLEVSTLPSTLRASLLDCDATYSYMVLGNLGTGYTIYSLGEADNSQRTVRATIGLKGLFDHAILTKETLTLKSGTVIDAYNSGDPTDTDLTVQVGTQSTADSSVILNSGVLVDGDVIVGVNGDTDTVIKDLGATVNGDKIVSTEEQSFNKVTPPALPIMGTSLTVKSGVLSITSDDNGTYSSIDLQSGKDIGVLEIAKGDVVLHITGDIDLDNSCEIVVKDGATLTLYVDGDIACGNGSGINTEAPPEEASTLKLYATGEGEQFLDVKAKSEWTGVIYAPNADVVLYANGDAYGSIVADGFEFKSGGNFHYDKALQEVDVDDQGVTFSVTRWYEGRASLTELEEAGVQELLSRSN